MTVLDRIESAAAQMKPRALDIFGQMKGGDFLQFQCSDDQPIAQSTFTCHGHRRPRLYRIYEVSSKMVNSSFIHLSKNIPAGGIDNFNSRGAV